MFKKLKLKGQSLKARLTGFSSPIVGLNWVPPVDEQDKARRVLVFLEDRRVLFNAFDMEVGSYVTHSILEIRQRLTQDLEDITKESPLGQSITAMRAACRKFLDETQKNRSRHMGLGPLFMTCLGELRAIFGVHVAQIAYAYDLEITGELSTIIPPDPDEN
jgi:hypothetical protein